MLSVKRKTEKWGYYLEVDPKAHLTLHKTSNITWIKVSYLLAKWMVLCGSGISTIYSFALQLRVT